MKDAPKCNKCSDVGFFYVESSTPRMPPSVTPCTCQLKKDIVANADRGWKGLSNAAAIKESPLVSCVGKNVWVTASYSDMRSHMKHVAFRQDPMWRFNVYTDVDLMTAWLSSTVLKRQDVFDADIAMNVASVSSKMHSLVDLIDPPELLVLHLGVKASRNSATPEVLLETLQVRLSQEKPVWVFDQPDQPFNHTHLAYSDQAQYLLQEFKRHIIKPSKGGSTASLGGIPSDTVGLAVAPIVRERPQSAIRPTPAHEDGRVFKIREPKKKPSFSSR